MLVLSVVYVFLYRVDNVSFYTCIASTALSVAMLVNCYGRFAKKNCNHNIFVLTNGIYCLRKKNPNMLPLILIIFRSFSLMLTMYNRCYPLLCAFNGLAACIVICVHSRNC